MLFDLATLGILLASAGLGARSVLRWLDPVPRSDRLGSGIAWGILAAGWGLASGTLPALVALATQRPLVRLPVVAAVSLAGWALARLLPARSDPREARSSEPASDHRRPNGIPSALAAAVPVAALHAFLLVENLLRPPSGYDALYYRLPMIVRWIDAGRLYMLPDVQEMSVLGNGDLWQLFFAAPGFERMLQIAFVPFGVLLAAAVAGVARELGAPRAAGLVAGCFALATPMVALQMHSSYVDLFGTAFVTASLYWILRLSRAGARADAAPAMALLAGLAAGIAAGTKLSFLAWSAGLAPCLAGALAWRGGSARRGRAALCAALFVVAASLGGGYWFFRAHHWTGWALHPVRLSVGDVDLGTGKPLEAYTNPLPRPAWAYAFYPWFEWKGRGFSYTIDNGLGPPFATFAVIGTLLAIGRLRSRRRTARARAGWIVAGYTLFGVALFFGLFDAYPRFALPLAAAMLAASGGLLGLLVRSASRATAALVFATVALGAAMIAIKPLEGLGRRLAAGDLGRVLFYDSPPLIEEQPPGTVVLNLGAETMNYPLLGSRWTNRVIETMLARAIGLRPPLRQSALDAYGVDLVYFEGHGPPPFEPGVRYETLFDEDNDGSRSPIVRRMRVFRVAHVEPASKFAIFAPVANRRAFAARAKASREAAGSDERP